MGHKSFAGKSIPVDFSRMSVRDFRIALEVIEENVSEAKKSGEEKLTGDKTSEITIPLRYLAEALHVGYTVSIEFDKIEEALKEIRIHVDALVEFEKVFFARVKEENKAIGRDRRRLKKSLTLRAVPDQGAWPSSAHS